MAEIKVSIPDITEKTNEMQQLKASYTEEVKPVISGSGQAVNIISDLVDMQKTLSDSVMTLLDNSIVFLENAKNSVDTTDKNAATAIEKEK